MNGEDVCDVCMSLFGNVRGFVVAASRNVFNQDFVDAGGGFRSIFV